MNKRHNNKERVGVHFIAHTIEEEFGWIFREQSIADVGIDALIEQCDKGNPTGSFIALQIKSGEGNVYEKEKSYTYYISNTHYHYWINLEIPIILTCYIKKKKKKIYWVELTRSNISKTETRWKIEIPKTQFLEKNSKIEFEKILLKNRKKPLKSKSKNTALDKLGKLAAVDQVSISLIFISQFVKVFGQQASKLANQTTEASLKEGYELELNKLKIQSEIQYILSSFASRTLTEISIYSQLFSDTLIGFRMKYHFIQSFNTIEIRDKLNFEISQLEKLKSTFNYSIEGVNSMKESIINLKNSNVIKDKQNLQMAILASEQIINEIRISQDLIDELLKSFEKKA